MPKQYGLTVSVLDMEGDPYAEYGTRVLRGAKKMVSTNICARDNERFTIKVEGDIPFPFEAEDNHAGRYNFRSLASREGSINVQDGSSRSRVHMESFNFIVQIHIDGSPDPERSSLLEVAGITPPSRAKVNLRGRLTQISPGKFINQNWFFSPVGIDVAMARLDLAKPDQDIPRDWVDRDMVDITQIMQGELLSSEKPNQPRQIEIRLYRIKESWARDLKARGFGFDTTWADTYPFRSGEGVYAKFIFQYMSQEKLVNLGLCSAADIPSAAGRRRLPLTIPRSPCALPDTIPNSRKRRAESSRITTNNAGGDALSTEQDRDRDAKRRLGFNPIIMGETQQLVLRPREHLHNEIKPKNPQAVGGGNDKAPGIELPIRSRQVWIRGGRNVERKVPMRSIEQDQTAMEIAPKEIIDISSDDGDDEVDGDGDSDGDGEVDSSDGASLFEADAEDPDWTGLFTDD